MNKRVYFLEQLKRAGVSTSDLLCSYKAVVRPVAEYVCTVWHSSVTVEQSDRIGSIQRRVMKIIFTDCAYTDACQPANLPSLVDRRQQLTIGVSLAGFVMLTIIASITCYQSSVTV